MRLWMILIVLLISSSVFAQEKIDKVYLEFGPGVGEFTPKPSGVLGINLKVSVPFKLHYFSFRTSAYQELYGYKFELFSSDPDPQYLLDAALQYGIHSRRDPFFWSISVGPGIVTGALHEFEDKIMYIPGPTVYTVTHLRNYVGFSLPVDVNFKFFYKEYFSLGLNAFVIPNKYLPLWGANLMFQFQLMRKDK